MRTLNIVSIILATTLLSSCGLTGPQQEVPQPAFLTDDAIGHSDQMIVVNHKGPRAQIHLAGATEPLWFSSVRDGLVYLKSPEKTAKVLVTYVNDIGVANSWDDMGKGNWISADDAYFVSGSDAVGGMGAPEFVPFGDEDKALEFASKRGGELLRITDIEAEMVLVPVDQMDMQMQMQDGTMMQDGMNTDEAPVDHSTMEMNPTTDNSGNMEMQSAPTEGSNQ